MLGVAALSLLLSWVQVSSDTYIVKSSAGEARAKRVLKELEEFHQLIGTFVFRSARLPELPIEVLVIGDDQTLKDLAPEYNGRKVGVAGYYQRGQDRDFIVLAGRVFPETLTNIVYHELTHYFLSRALVVRPAWLNEGLAEYFATAEVRDDEVSLGGLSPERMLSLRTNSLLPLKEFFAIDSSSPYYNESLKASVFYAQSWAFVHYLMHGEHGADFRRYLEALTTNEASLFDYLKAGEPDLEAGFQAYVKVMLPRAVRAGVPVNGEAWSMKVESIPDFEAKMSIAEIFLANGQFDRARRHLEAVGPELTRASYYRGVLARLAGDPGARDFFIDALLDRHLGPRAAAQLVQMGDMDIPAVRTALEDASAAGTRNPEVYLALAAIHSEDVRRIEETVRLSQRRSVPPVPSPKSVDLPPAEPSRERYAQGAEQNVHYQLLSETASRPRIERLVRPDYPAELLSEKLAGEVVIDIQVTEEGKVAGMWLVSAIPDIFANLATAAVRQWQFEAMAAKIRVVIEFRP
ncbi:MAG: TonB family protein [Acidobacteria bacterium]|nr:TonB family protein [Acidobacteriota bacterium]